MPLFIFDLNKDTISNWVTLCAPAVRCALEKCGTSGWIFVGWQKNDGGHYTAFFFKDEKQVGFDPSTVLRVRYNDTEGVNPWEYFKEHHMWLSPSEPRNMSMVDDIRRGVNLQCLFSTIEDTDTCALNGCCTTVSILMVWLCLRFGCQDPQTMADALRCVLKHARRRARQVPQGSPNPFMKFLLQLRAWQNRMAETEDWKHDDLLRWLKIRVEPEARSYFGRQQVAPWP